MAVLSKGFTAGRAISRAARYNHMTSGIQKLTTASCQSAGTPSVTKVVTGRSDSLLRMALAPASECNVRVGKETLATTRRANMPRQMRRAVGCSRTLHVFVAGGPLDDRPVLAN